MKNSKEILFFKQCSGLTTPEEDDRIRDILACSEENRKEMETVKEIASLEKRIAGLSGFDTEKGYRKMMQKAGKYESRKRVGNFFLKACAVMILPLFFTVGALVYRNLELKNMLDYTSWQNISAAPGTVTSVELPDHSTVWINSGSTISYPVIFRNGKREVRLTGEAFFDVESDSKHPFLVRTDSGLDVVAHGTQFNVSAYSDEKEVETTLVEGSVSLLLGGEVKCQLDPGESGLYSTYDNLLRIKHVNTIEKTAWTQGKIIFRNAPMEEVFDRLGRRYNIDFIFHDPYKLSDQYRCRITFEDETIQQVMGYLKMAAPIRYESYAPLRQDGDVLERQRIEVWLEKR